VLCWCSSCVIVWVLVMMLVMLFVVENELMSRGCLVYCVSLVFRCLRLMWLFVFLGMVMMLVIDLC